MRLHIQRIASVFAVSTILLSGCQTSSHEARHGDRGPVVDSDSDVAMPGGVASGFRREFPNAKMTQLRKVTHRDGTEHYEVRYTTKDGQPATAEFDKDGRLLR